MVLMGNEDTLRRDVHQLAIATEQIRREVDQFQSRIERLEGSIDGKLYSINVNITDIRADLAARKMTSDKMEQLRVVGDYIHRLMPRMMALGILMVTILAAFGGAIVWQVASLSAQSATATQLALLSEQFEKRAKEVDGIIAELRGELNGAR